MESNVSNANTGTSNIMKNHKWVKLTEYEYGTKPHQCEKCGISKKWVGGDYQCWEYIFPPVGDPYLTGIKKTYSRPDCETKISKNKSSIFLARSSKR